MIEAYLRSRNLEGQIKASDVLWMSIVLADLLPLAGSMPVDSAHHAIQACPLPFAQNLLSSNGHRAENVEVH